LIELMFVVGLLVTMAGASVPWLVGNLDDLHARGAVRYLSTRLQQARMEAIARNANTALRVVRTDTAFAFTRYVDGNRNGVRSVDMARGLDFAIGAEERLGDQFPGVDFGVIPNLPAVEPSSAPPGTDPVRLGAGDMVVFTPHGTATPGSLYVRGRGSAQLVVRIFGETGKTKILRFDRSARAWKPL
jgi:hypothetical protein